MEGRADLHIHTTHSDGAFSARAIVGHARRAGLTTISITDHDTTGAIDEAIAAGRDCGVAVIPGVELSTSLDGQDVHILGYFIDHTHGGIQAHLELLRKERLLRAERIVGRLNALNVPLPFEAVLDQAGSGSIGRPHIAHAMVELGLTQTYHEAFLKYIGAGRPAYERHATMSPREAVVLIAMAGGLSFIAHPGASVTDDMLKLLIADGVDGIETVHPCHTPERETFYAGIAAEYFLLTSGGSDFHGAKKRDPVRLGIHTIPEPAVAAMRRRLFGRPQSDASEGRRTA
jgi:hypothetical protein